jgi:phytoene/squalene synthetase
MGRHTIGHETDAAIPYAATLGVALLLTKILRDTDEVCRIGRLNLAQDELARFRLGETSLSRPSVTMPGCELMCFRLAGTRRQ